MELKEKTVRNIFTNCILGMSDFFAPIDPILITWHDMNIGFHPGRLEESRQAIEELLLRLNPRFRDGCSIKYLRQDETGRRWGDEQSVIQLACLGLALGACKKIVSEKDKNAPEVPPYLKLVRKENGEETEDMEATGSYEGGVFEVWRNPDYDH